MDDRSRISAFQLQEAQRLLYRLDLTWTKMVCAILRKVENLGYDRQLFVVILQKVVVTGLSSYYSSMLWAWHRVLTVERDISQSEEWIFEEPLFHNLLIQTKTLYSASVQACMVKKSCTRLAHLRAREGWRSSEEL